ncbi:hypothetical protein ACHAWO_000951 [Cyclotella atomus]|uniref:ABC transporter domain-containing protein n=1 Tax=Cyclotella atomus TaxID=382360 RepID=A0ABD3MML1_9STRA
MQTLFSSVPKREYALQNINLSFGHVPPTSSAEQQKNVNDGVIVLDGRSASGKSTILRLLAGIESPTQGGILINGKEIIQVDNEGKRKVPTWMKVGLSNTYSAQAVAQPVILESKPDFDKSQTVIQRIVQMGSEAADYYCPAASSERRKTLIQKLAIEFAQLLTITKEQQSCRPVDLSPSSQFLFAIACGCMVSIAPAVAAIDSMDINSTTDQGVSIPYPIILFDELFDTEASSTVDKCKAGILNLVDRGGVVISVTHRPVYFTEMSRRCVTLSGGKILTDRRTMT